MAATLTVPLFPQAGADPSAWLDPYALLIVVEWLFLSAVVVIRLWRAGRGLPTVAKRRTQLLAAAAAVVALAVILGAATPMASPTAISQIVVGLVGILSALLFLVGFTPPQFLLQRWRRGEVSSFEQSLTGLVTATGPDEVIGTLLPRIARSVGARGAALSLGHHVDTVGNGQEALAAVRQLPYDVVLMDVQMPVMDGLEATRRIRAELPRQGQPRIVALTANVLADVQAACASAGMDGYLAKPVRTADLAAALAEARSDPQAHRS